MFGCDYNSYICLHYICIQQTKDMNQDFYSSVIIVINLTSVCIACGVIYMIKHKSPTTVKLSGSYISWIRVEEQARKNQPTKKRLIEILAG